jgi:hypothetical protein
MSFARWKGVQKEGLVPGKAYPAESAMGGPAAGGGMRVFLGSPGKFFHVTEAGLESWEVSEKVYAVALRGIEDVKPGEVLVATDWTQDGKVEVEGMGYYGSEWLEVLDRTNVFPGVTILDLADEHWKRVVAVDEALWVRVDGLGEFRSPEEFKFPVSDSCELLAEPLVTCVRTMDTRKPHSVYGGVTEGKRYYLHMTTGDGKFVLKGDGGEPRLYPRELFRMG